MMGSLYFAIGVLVGILVMFLSFLLVFMTGQNEQKIEPEDPYKKTYHIINIEDLQADPSSLFIPGLPDDF